MIRVGLLLGGIALLGVGGCGSNVTDASGSASGSGGSSDGGAGAGGQGTGGLGSDAGGGGGFICGGKAGVACPSDTFCLFDDPGTCGNADGIGHCTPRPTGCPKSCSDPLVCGCDGAMYCNPCIANAAGTDVSSSSTCDAPNQQYSASPMVTNISRFAVFKIDFNRGVCVRFIVEGDASGTTPGISTPQGWSVSGAEITNTIDDCALVNGYLSPPLAGHVSADAGSGSITFMSSGAPPAEITLHAALTFPVGGPPWVPASEPLDADHLPLQ